MSGKVGSNVLRLVVVAVVIFNGRSPVSSTLSSNPRRAKGRKEEGPEC